jgi:hypothetical protein
VKLTSKIQRFWSQNIDIKKLVCEGDVLRIISSVISYLKKQFYTLKNPGKLTIEPLSMDVDMQLPTNRKGRFLAELS